MYLSSRLSQAFSALVFCSLSLGASPQATIRTPLTKSAASCPVQFRNLELHGDHLVYSFRNSSDKPIQGMVFGLAYFDAVQDPHRVVVLGGDNKNLSPGQYRKSAFDIKYWHHTGYDGWTIWPSKVLFKDGSTWSMGHEATACSAAHWMQKQVAPPSLPEAVLTMPVEALPQKYR
jgi:hypothetical protein